MGGKLGGFMKSDWRIGGIFSHIKLEERGNTLKIGAHIKDIESVAHSKQPT